MIPSITVPEWAQGRAGMGQGGWSASRFAIAIDEPVVISFRSPIPIETPMTVGETATGWSLTVAEGAGSSRIVMEAERRAADHFEAIETPAVNLADAADARTRFPEQPDTEGRPTTHNAPGCFSCGFGERTMRVWPGELGDGSGRVASDFTPPAWVAGADGVVDPSAIWTALDCACGFYVGHRPARRSAVTGRYAVELLAPLVAGETYTIVGFTGPHAPEWERRKRGACSAIFDRFGQLMARSDSLWIALD